jgi:hypothetical protein
VAAVENHQNGCIPYIARVSGLLADLSDSGDSPIYALQIKELQGV